MEKPARYKAKNKKSTGKPKAVKKKDGPSCSMFLAEIARKLAAKRKQDEESPKNIVQTIIDSITNALPMKFSRKSPEKKDSPVRIETLQNFAPELLPNDLVEIPITNPDPMEDEEEETIIEVPTPGPASQPAFKMPKMPLVSSEILKVAAEKRRKALMRDVSMNTGSEHDMASELAKHVGTLKKISLIAEEFNQKTAKNLKEIVDSVQEDLIKKLEEIKEEQKLQQQALQIREEQPPEQTD